MQEEIIYLPVHIAKPINSTSTPPEATPTQIYTGIKQALFGITLTALGIYSAILTGDGTAAFIIVPLGIGSIFKKIRKGENYYEKQ